MPVLSRLIRTQFCSSGRSESDRNSVGFIWSSLSSYSNVPRAIKSALIISILTTTVVGMVVGAIPVPQGLGDLISFDLPSIAPTFGKLDLKGALAFGYLISSSLLRWWSFSITWEPSWDC